MKKLKTNFQSIILLINSFKKENILTYNFFSIKIFKKNICCRALVEGGFDYNPMKYELSAEEHEAMRSKSPISHVGNVVSPILFLLGKKDLRVPMSQGLDYYHALKARNIKTR